MNVTVADMTASLVGLGVTLHPAQGHSEQSRGVHERGGARGAVALSMTDALVDAETTRLAIRAQAGDADAFCALIELHQRAARRVAAAALGNHADVDEAVQDACLTAWQRLDRLDDPAAFRAWLLKIAWRKALDRRRSIVAWLKRVRIEGPVAGTDARDDHPLADLLVDNGMAADEQLVARERDRIVAQMIRSLPTRLRDPLLLAVGSGQRYEDVADMLGLPLGTLKWRVSEARRVLREKLERIGVGLETAPSPSQTRRR
jgi:RNA polymerase sigma-70 factor (ECF subfamily)